MSAPPSIPCAGPPASGLPMPTTVASVVLSVGPVQPAPLVGAASALPGMPNCAWRLAPAPMSALISARMPSTAAPATTSALLVRPASTASVLPLPAPLDRPAAPPLVVSAPTPRPMPRTAAPVAPRVMPVLHALMASANAQLTRTSVAARHAW